MTHHAEMKKNSTGEKNSVIEVSEADLQDKNSPYFTKLCEEFLEMNVKIAYDMLKSDKLNI